MTLRIKMRGLGLSVFSLSFNLGGLLAGALLALYFDVFSATPWALLLFPGVLSVRGAIGGVLSGRLSTALHLGVVRPRFTENTKTFATIMSSIVALTLGSSLLMGLASSLFNTVLLGAPAVDGLAILAVSVATMGLSLVFVSPITVGIAVLAFKKQLDPDVIVYPVVSTVTDVLVTLCYLGMLQGFLASPVLIGFIDLICVLVMCSIAIKKRKEAEFVKTLKEFSLTLVLVAIIVNVTGSLLGKVSHDLGRRPELYVVYPALIDTVGDVGSIVGSTATTKLALGTMGSSFACIKQHLAEIGGAWSASLLLFTLYAILAASLNASSEVWGLMLPFFTTNLIAVSCMVIISFAVAIFTQKRGWDPDNFVIPIESALADAVTTASLLLALTMMA
jgi:mgtE-like transporter